METMIPILILVALVVFVLVKSGYVSVRILALTQNS